MVTFKLSVLLVVVVAVHGWARHKDEIPNGDAIPNPCDKSEMATRVGAHSGHIGGKAANGLSKFGLDFKAAGMIWTRDLCMKDSDGDGMLNGAELGDPSCSWKKGDPSPGAAKGHPGECEPIWGDICRVINVWLTEENCPALGMPPTTQGPTPSPTTPTPTTRPTTTTPIPTTPSPTTPRPTTPRPTTPISTTPILTTPTTIPTTPSPTTPRPTTPSPTTPIHTTPTTQSTTPSPTTPRPTTPRPTTLIPTTPISTTPIPTTPIPTTPIPTTPSPQPTTPSPTTPRPTTSRPTTSTQKPTQTLKPSISSPTEPGPPCGEAPNNGYLMKCKKCKGKKNGWYKCNRYKHGKKCCCLDHKPAKCGACKVGKKCGEGDLVGEIMSCSCCKDKFGWFMCPKYNPDRKKKCCCVDGSHQMWNMFYCQFFKYIDPTGVIVDLNGIFPGYLNGLKEKLPLGIKGLKAKLPGDFKGLKTQLLPGDLKKYFKNFTQP